MTFIYEDRLDHAHIARAAEWAAHELRENRVARVILTPGDMTRYPILIAAPWWEWIEREGRDTNTQLGHEYWVALCSPFGGGYPWTGDWVHWTYASEKWVGRVNEASYEHVGHVMAAFLNALAKALAP